MANEREREREKKCNILLTNKFSFKSNGKSKLWNLREINLNKQANTSYTNTQQIYGHDII